MKPTLAAYLFGYDLERIRYPWREALASALDLVGPDGAVFFCECYSDDGTWEALRAEWMARSDPRFVLLRHPWGTSHEIQVTIANYLLGQIGRHYQWALKLDADEVLGEWSFDAFWEALERLNEMPGVSLGRPHYTHLCPDDHTQFPFIYQRKAVLSRTRTGLVYNDNDACALGGGPEVDVPLEILHLGKMAMGREREALVKEVTFTKLYTDLGFPDQKVEAQRPQGYLDYRKVFDLALGRGEFTPYDGPWPKYLDYYLSEARERARLFAEELAAGKVLDAV